MSAQATDLTIYGFAFAALVHLAFAGYLVAARRFGRDGGPTSHFFVAAVLCSAVWAAAAAMAGAEQSGVWLFASEFFDIARYGLWFGFLLLLKSFNMFRPIEQNVVTGQGGLTPLTLDFLLLISP